MQTFGDCGNVGSFAHIFQQHRKLVAAQACDDVIVFANRKLQSIRESLALRRRGSTFPPLPVVCLSRVMQQIGGNEYRR